MITTAMGKSDLVIPLEVPLQVPTWGYQMEWRIVGDKEYLVGIVFKDRWWEDKEARRLIDELGIETEREHDEEKTGKEEG